VTVVVFLGPPGVGKGTQAGLLADRLGALHVSTGIILRSELETGSDLAKAMQAVMARGDLVSDEQLFLCLGSALGRIGGFSEKLLLLDGVPRNLAQIGLLDGVLSARGARVDLALALVAPLEQLVARFAKRWSCAKCGAVFAFEKPPEGQQACRRCGAIGSLRRRPDDEPDAVKHRFNVYEQATAPVLSEYRNRGLLSTVDGLADQEGVYSMLQKELRKIF
jgi:adenylate kinase